MSIKDTYIKFKCPRCKGDGVRKYFSRKSVCDNCTTANRSEKMTGKRWAEKKHAEEERNRLEEEKKLKEKHLKTIFVSDQSNFYQSPEGDIL